MHLFIKIFFNLLKIKQTIESTKILLSQPILYKQILNNMF